MKTIIKALTRPYQEQTIGNTNKLVLPKVTKEQAQIKQNTKYRIIVKDYMTKKSTPAFDFMEKFNNNIPMPNTEIIAEITKETKGMVYLQSEEFNGWCIKSAILHKEEI